MQPDLNCLRRGRRVDQIVRGVYNVTALNKLARLSPVRETGGSPVACAIGNPSILIGAREFTGHWGSFTNSSCCNMRNRAQSEYRNAIC